MKELSVLENSLIESTLCNVISKSELLENYIKKSNIFICDISAVVSECLAVNAPIFLYIPKEKEIKISQSNMPYEDYCYIYSTSSELKEKITDVLNGNDYLANNRLKAINYIIGLEETKNDAFIKKLKSIGANSVQ